MRTQGERKGGRAYFSSHVPLTLQDMVLVLLELWFFACFIIM